MENFSWKFQVSFGYRLKGINYGTQYQGSGLDYSLLWKQT